MGKETKEESAEIMVVKFGSSVVTHDSGVDRFRIGGYANELAQLKKSRRLGGLIVVTSGAVAAGRGRYEAMHDYSEYVDEQVLAGLGSGAIYGAWEKAFEDQDILTGQLLVTHREIDSKEGDVLAEALEKNAAEDIVTITNENDLLSLAELKKLAYGGDNDGLAAHVASRIEADILLLLTDTDGFMMDGETVPEISGSNREDLMTHCTDGSKGTGGMASKVEAAFEAVDSGVEMVHIGGASGIYEDMLGDIDHSRPGTRVVQ